MLKAVIFDLDGTLIDWSGFSADWEVLNRGHLEPVHAYLTENGHEMPTFDVFVDDINHRSRYAWEGMQPD